jgi:hypothetical protein
VQLWCTEARGWVKVACRHGGSTMWVPVRCKTCAGCRERHKRKVQRRILAGLMKSPGALALLTLTSLPGTDVPDMMKAWNRFRGWLRRRNADVQYVTVKEFGSRTGMLHLHVVLGNWRRIDQRVLSEQWARCSGARVVDIRKVKEQALAGAAWYVAKYVSKSLSGDLRKAVTFSRGWPEGWGEDQAGWRCTGERWDRSSPPPGNPVAVLGAGCLVVTVGECACLEGAKEFGLVEQFRLWKLARWRGKPDSYSRNTGVGHPLDKRLALADYTSRGR